MGLAWYITRRVAWAVIATWLILTIAFVLLRLTPNVQIAELQFQAAQAGGDPQAAAEAFRRRRGLDRPLYAQYIDFMMNMLSLNWGWSETRSQPVMTAILQAIPYSMMYGIPAVVISTVLGILIGLYSATHQYTRSDYAATFFAFFGVSIPNFWFAIVLLVIFGTLLGWVPHVFDPQAAKMNGEFAIATLISWENIRQLILPVVVLTTGAIAGLMRYSRAEALEYVQAQFVKTARAKGVSERTILYKHIFRPASVPIATILVGDLLGIIFVSSYLIEVVFGIPGLGTLSFRAIVQQDTALVLGTILIPTFIAIVGNLAQDIAYMMLDPRIDYGDR